MPHPVLEKRRAAGGLEPSAALMKTLRLRER